MSYRALTIDLMVRRVPTPTGKGNWHAKTVRHMLRNPIYCGRGRTLRYHTNWPAMRDEERARLRRARGNGQVEQCRGGDRDVPVDPARVPVIIPPDLFDRVQAKLALYKDNRGAPRRIARYRSELDRLVRCERCKSYMVRGWQRNDLSTAATAAARSRGTSARRMPSPPRR